MTTTMKSSFVGLLFSLSATLGNAEEGGEVTLTIAGQDYVLPLHAEQSDWSGSRDYGSVSITVRPTDNATREKFRGFNIGFEFGGDQASNPEARLARIAAGDVEQLFGKADTGGLSVQIQSVSVSGDELTIAGTFSGVLGASSDYGRTIDQANSVPVSGSIAVTLGPV